MKRISYLFIASAIMLGACTGGFKKGVGNSEYKIISGSKGKKIEYGNFVEITFKTQVKDTVIQSSEDNGRQIFVLDSVGLPKMYFNAFSKAKVGDSVVVKMSVDSFFRGNIPPYAKKGQVVYNMFRIVNAFQTKEQADSANAINQQFAQERQMKKYMEQMKKDSLEAIPQLAKDSKSIEDYLAKNNIKAVKGKLGTYVEIITPGTGPKLDTGVAFKVNYSGRTFDGNVFDSNTDPKFNHVEPYTVEIPADINMAGVIHGWIDGFRELNNGSKARFYIPSSLGYGKKGNGEKIKPNDNLIFDIEVVGILSREQAMKDAMEKQKMQQEMMQQMQQQQQQQQQNGQAPKQ